MFSLIYIWINSWINNREAGDLRRYRAHYDVIVMIPSISDVSVRSEITLKYGRMEQYKPRASETWHITGDFPAQRSSNAEMFPFDDVIMFLHMYE